MCLLFLLGMFVLFLLVGLVVLVLDKIVVLAIVISVLYVGKKFVDSRF